MDGSCCKFGSFLCSCLWKECEPQRQIIYDLENNFQRLKDERAKLREKNNARKREISDAEDIGMKPTDTLTGWLDRVEAMEVLLEQILGPENNPIQLPDKCPSGCCYANLLFAYKLGKKVADTLPRAIDLREESLMESDKFVPAPMDDLLVEQIFGLDTEFNDLLHHLDQPGSQIIRVCGMGGVGKTALMKKTHNEFRTKRHAFNVIIWVDASSSSDILSIQQAVGSKLRLQWTEDTRPHARAINLNVSLKKRSFLLFIDDPGKNVTLMDVGIPVHDNHNDVTLMDVGIPVRDKHNDYKVVFSTTDESVNLGLGGSQYLNVQVNLLQWEDAWNLFQQAVGKEALTSDPKKAKSVAELCGGLPLTLVTVGRSMSSKRYSAEWAHTEEMLKKFDPKIVNMEDIYERFHVSYNSLKTRNTVAQSCFLYFSLFPRDFLVRKEELLDYWLGENLLTEAHELNTIRSQGEEVISTLRSACLLERGEDDDIIRMHNTVRGSALWIATSRGERKGAVWAESRVDLPELPTKHLNWENVERISLMHCKINKLNRITRYCSHLSTLILRHSILKEISVGFFKAMICLKVLDLSCCDIINFPSEITLLTELQYLNMSHNHISALPSELKKLTKLKFLDLSFVPELQQIPGGVIKSLTNLLVLNMYSSGYEHKKKGGVLSGRGLTFFWGGTDQTLFEELKSLTYLQDLRISVNGYNSLESLRGSAKLSCIHSLFMTKCPESSLSISQMVNLKVFRVYNCPQLDDLKVNYVNNLTHVEIESCWALKDLTWLGNATNLHSLKVDNCINMVAIIRGSSSNEGADNTIFSSLRSLYLDNLPALKIIYERNLAFPCLEEIMVHSCPNLYELPLAETAVGTLKAIRGHESWWKDLRMNVAVKDAFRTYFKSSDT